MRQRSWALVAAAVVLFLSACAERGPVLLEGIAYQAPEKTATTASKVTVGVSPFKDERGTAASLIGKRVIRHDIANDVILNDLIVQGTAADIVSAGIKEALRARGVTVKDVAAWDLNAETIAASGANIIIGGEIKTFWVDATSEPLNVKVRADVQLRVVVADTAAKTIFRTLLLNSKVERQDIAFSFDTVAGALSEALSGALDQLMNDGEFKKRMQ